MSNNLGTTTRTDVPRPTDRRTGLVGFIARHPLTAFLVWFFTVGQAFAFTPVVVDTGLPAQLFIVGSTLFGLLLPTVVITRIADGPAGLRALRRRAFDTRVSLGWYAFALIVVPLAAFAFTAAFVGLPTGLSPGELGTAFVANLLLPLILTFVPNNWWEEVAWTGLVQTRLQDRRGPWLAAVITGVLFALQHISLVAHGGLAEGGLAMSLLILLAIPFRFVTGWVYNRTASLFLVGLVHGVGDAVTGGSGFQPGLLARLYPGSSVPGVAHLMAFAVIGLVVVAVTRGRLGRRSSPDRLRDA
jgi:membrane protease YdiL (CAAX protease family)